MPKAKKQRANPALSPSLGEAIPMPVPVVEADEPVVQHAMAPHYEPPKEPKWTLLDPKLTQRQRDEQSRWIAVFTCANPAGIHHTKAYNDTPASEVPCHKCGWPTTMHPMFTIPPIKWRDKRVMEKVGRDDFEGSING